MAKFFVIYYPKFLTSSFLGLSSSRSNNNNNDNDNKHDFASHWNLSSV